MESKILIADDESDIVSMLGSFFESKGFRVLPAFNGAEALKQVEKQPDIILLDINMPGTDGLEVCKRIRDHISCPILFLTARIEDTDTAILTTALVAAFNLLLALIFYGTEGLDCSILFAPSDYAEGFIPFNITCGTLLKYQILLAFTCTLSVTGITLLISAISKNQIVAFVASMAIFLFPVLLPITEANPLFRLIGLLPLYHVQAVSLLSVEQMSNGMLYAVWAIPTALLFLGIGAVISRRVFAKHQVS